MLESRKYFLISVTIILFLTMGTLFVSNVDKTNSNDPVGGKDRPYYFRIELSQWTMKIIDLNRIEDFVLSGYSLNEAYVESTYIDSIGKFEKGSEVFLQIYSLDVQHGISINELDIYISILEPTDDIASTIPYFYDFYLPESDTSFTAYCQVYCGMGHSNMKLRFDIGAGEPNHGKLIFNVFIILNAILAILFAYFITTPIKRKVYLTKEIFNPNKDMNSNLIKFKLYDISKLTEKELIAFRQGYLNIEKTCNLLETFLDQSIEDVRTQVLSGDIVEECDLIEF